MSTSEELLQVLAEFGLTNVQARVYLASVKLKLASVSQISMFSKVRKEDVYRSLPKLESLGLVEKTLSVPVKIRATPVDQAFSILIRQEQNRTNEKVTRLQAKRDKIVKHFASTPEIPSQEEQANFSLLLEREQILGKVAKLIENANLELDFVYGRNKLVQCLYACAQELRQATQRGVRLRIISDLLDYTESNQKLIKELLQSKASIKIRYTDVPLSHFLVSDFKEALLSTSAEGNLAEHQCLWTDNTSLVEILHRNFESLWHEAIDPREITEQAISSRILEYTQKLRPTNHAIFVYDSINAKHQILFGYVNAGLTRNEAAIYVASEETPMEIKTAMKKYGIDVGNHEKTGALQILNYDEVYVRDGKFDAERSIDFWKKEYYRMFKKFGGLRVTGETSWFFKHNLVADLITYEKTLHRTLDIPVIAICAYNSKDLEKNKESIKVYTELIQTHGTTILTALDDKFGMVEIRT